jgi:GDP-L-fucose synthase
MIRNFMRQRLKINPLLPYGEPHPRREFLHVDDLADACVFLMQNYSEPGFVNIGTGTDISINELAMLIRNCGYEGEIAGSFPSGWETPRS